MLRWIQIAGLVAIVGATTLPPTWAQEPGQEQDQEEYDRAEEAALDVSSWKELHLWFSQYLKYDDGQIAVMNDGFVEQELARHWDRLPQLAEETDKDPAFLQFVLSHLNEGTGCDARRQIVARAEKKTTRTLAPLCRALAAKLRESAPPDCPPRARGH